MPKLNKDLLLYQACFCLYLLSHPVWVRELKGDSSQTKQCSYRSHPVWVRELKDILPDRSNKRYGPVAPCMGA